MSTRARKYVSLVLLFAMFALQAHVVMHYVHDDDDGARQSAQLPPGSQWAAGGLFTKRAAQPQSHDSCPAGDHDGCAICSLVLAQVAVGTVVVSPPEPVFLPFAIEPSRQSKACSHSALALPTPRGPPAAVSA